MPAKGSPLVTFRAGELVEGFAARGPESQRGSIAKRDLGRYYDLLAEAFDLVRTHVLNRDQLAAVRAIADHRFAPSAGATRPPKLADVVTILRVDGQSDADLVDIADALDTLSPLQRTAVADWLERCWVGAGGSYVS